MASTPWAGYRVRPARGNVKEPTTAGGKIVRRRPGSTESLLDSRRPPRLSRAPLVPPFRLGWWLDLLGLQGLRVRSPARGRVLRPRRKKGSGFVWYGFGNRMIRLANPFPSRFPRRRRWNEKAATAQAAIGREKSRRRVPTVTRTLTGPRTRCRGCPQPVLGLRAGEGRHCLASHPLPSWRFAPTAAAYPRTVQWHHQRIPTQSEHLGIHRQQP
jgi:hypothetical protein